MRWALTRWVFFAVLLGIALWRAPVAIAAEARCQTDPPPPAVATAKAKLAEDATDVPARLSLVDALLDQACYADAVTVIQAGIELHPRNKELQTRLRDTRSLMSEENYFEGLGEAQETARLQRNVLRCNELQDLVACDEALARRPDDARVLLGKGDALLKANRPVEALAVLRHADQINPGNDLTAAKLAAAESQREALAARCQTGTDATAVEACQAALLHGGNDEFALYARAGLLLQGVDRPAEALDAYMAAQGLKSDDQPVALAIVALTESSRRQDALALAARGTALMALDRSTEALSPLRQARALSPSLPGLQARLVSAEGLARKQARAVTPSTLLAQAGASARGGSREPASAAAGAAPEGAVRAQARSYSNSDPIGESH
jgi:tetratricopeptide (TPR) repeat protein